MNWLFLSAAVIIIDQITKIMALKYLVPGDSVSLMPFLNFTLAFNKGAAFSFLSQQGGWQLWFLSIFALIVCGVLLLYLYYLPKRPLLNLFALSLVIGGALGNVMDRIQYGYVVDFIDVYVKDWHWPVFNAADTAVTIGAILFIFSFLRQSKTEKS